MFLLQFIRAEGFLNIVKGLAAFVRRVESCDLLVTSVHLLLKGLVFSPHVTFAFKQLVYLVFELLSSLLCSSEF